jgi:hypothetical protein
VIYGLRLGKPDVEKGEEVDYTLEKVTLEPSESDHDEIAIFIGGADFRKHVFKLLKYVEAV